MVGKKVPDSDLDFKGERAGRSVEFHCQGRKRKEAASQSEARKFMND